MKQVILLVALILAAISGADISAGVTLYWEANTEPPIVAKYRLMSDFRVEFMIGLMRLGTCNNISS